MKRNRLVTFTLVVVVVGLVVVTVAVSGGGAAKLDVGLRGADAPSHRLELGCRLRQGGQAVAEWMTWVQSDSTRMHVRVTVPGGANVDEVRKRVQPLLDSIRIP